MLTAHAQGAPQSGASKGGSAATSGITGPPNAVQGFSQNRDKPIQIDAARLEVRDKSKIATFFGDAKNWTPSAKPVDTPLPEQTPPPPAPTLDE